MKQFILIYKVNNEAMTAMATITPEEQQKSMKDWHEWRDGLGQNLEDFGVMFFGGKSISSTEQLPVSPETMGYTLIQAEGLEKAIKLSTSHPHLKWHKGSSIEVREYFKMP